MKKVNIFNGLNKSIHPLPSFHSGRGLLDERDKIVGFESENKLIQYENLEELKKSQSKTYSFLFFVKAVKNHEAKNFVVLCYRLLSNLSFRKDLFSCLCCLPSEQKFPMI